MFRDPKKLLDYEVSRKPEIADIVSRAHTMSDDEIDSLNIMMWIKKELKSRNEEIHRLRRAAELLPLISYGFSADPLGTIVKWHAGNAYIELDKGSIEVKTNEFLWFPDSGGLWIGSVFTKKIDPKIASMSHPLNKVTRSEYLNKVREQINSDHASVEQPQQSSGSFFKIVKI